ncbi:MAG: hypothetical protein Q9P01_22015 [Anaerolineae bacterium]|nr:hypothetical protein [Anaerolineae bacterium]MDQ7037415.1 hypothetical protein [Anaerolineae bacterium]
MTITYHKKWEDLQKKAPFGVLTRLAQNGKVGARISPKHLVKQVI